MRDQQKGNGQKPRTEKRKGMAQNTKRNLREKAFQRDGWLEDASDDDPDDREIWRWRAMCSFGCGEILNWATATLDRYPIMGKDGGTYVLENIRLACRACNSACRNHKEFVPKRKAKRAKRKQLRMQARLDAGVPTKSDLQRLAYEGHNVPRVREYPAPGYSAEVKRKLRENYPKSSEIDKNGIRIRDVPVIYDVAKGKFRYDN